MMGMDPTSSGVSNQNPHKRLLISDPDFKFGEYGMRFRLTYQGELLGGHGNNSRAAHKHDVRKQLHPQLKRLWETNPILSGLGAQEAQTLESFYKALLLPDVASAGDREPRPFLELLQEREDRYGIKWVPAITEELYLTCGIEILYLRPGARGGAMQSGDIDSRIKTIFDALGMPRSGGGLPDEDKGDEPIYTLVKDDSLFSHVSVETDELLRPTTAKAGKNDSHVIITVNIQPTIVTLVNLGFAGS